MDNKKELCVARKEWNTDTEQADSLVDRVVFNLMGENAVPVAYMAIDMVFRPYVQWMNSARNLGESTNHTYASMVNLIAVMIMECSTRIRTKDEDGNTLSTDEWVRDLLYDVRDELVASLEDIHRPQGHA